MIKKAEIFKLTSMEPSNLTDNFKIDHSLILTNDDGYTSYISLNEKNKNPEVVYKLNKDGFRTENFKKLDNKAFNVLASGCSCTYGQGVPQEYSWSQTLAKKLQMKLPKPLKMHNLGVMGASVHLTIKNAMAFIREYGAPDEIYLLLPPDSRKLVYVDRIKNFKSMVMSSAGYKKIFDGNDPETKRFYESHSEEESYLLSITLIGLFEDFCSSNNIKLIWTSYAQSADEDLYDKVGFKFYKKYTIDDCDDYHDQGCIDKMPKNIESISHWEIGADDEHPGVWWHTEVAKMFYDLGRQS
jgi:hypothetical protein